MYNRRGPPCSWQGNIFRKWSNNWSLHIFYHWISSLVEPLAISWAFGHHLNHQNQKWEKGNGGAFFAFGFLKMGPQHLYLLWYTCRVLVASVVELLMDSVDIVDACHGPTFWLDLTCRGVFLCWESFQRKHENWRSQGLVSCIMPPSNRCCCSVCTWEICGMVWVVPFGSIENHGLLSNCCFHRIFFVVSGSIISARNRSPEWRGYQACKRVLSASMFEAIPISRLFAMSVIHF